LEGHHWLLSSLFDIEAVQVGEKLNSYDLVSKYGIQNIPKFPIYITYDENSLLNIFQSIIYHGKQINDLDGAQDVVKEYALDITGSYDILHKLKM